MKRRAFLQGTALGSATLFSGGLGLLSWAPRSVSATVEVALAVRAGYVPMVDGTSAYMVTFSGSSGVEFPGPTIICREGDLVTVSIQNPLSIDTAFRIGRTAIREVIGAGSSTTFGFDAPAPGTYLYYDDQNDGVNRVMGLHGTLVVMPADSDNRSFPGGPTFVRQYKWLLSSIDTAWGDHLANNGLGAIAAIDPAGFSPRYFTINGSSFDQTNEPNTQVKGLVGDTTLIRLLNGGGMVNSPHFHGNHVQIVSVNGANSGDPRKEKDIVSMYPLDTRDVLLPMHTPPDAWPPAEGAQSYPMHCHAEMSQTAGGGFYPHGMHASITIGEAPDSEPELG